MMRMLLAAVVAMLLQVGAAQAQTDDLVSQARQLREASRVRMQPRVLGYDAKLDTFQTQSSVASGSGAAGRPGGEASYYGNRLQQFRFLGPSEQGGFYEAYQWYIEGLNLDPRNYQYRFR